MCCFLIGHRDTPLQMLPVLHTTLEHYITERGVTEFVVGHYGNFDRIALVALKELKVRYPHIRLLLLLPYYAETNAEKLPEGFDESWYPERAAAAPRRIAILSANRAAVERANYLIAYVCHPSNGASSILEYARQREKQGLLQVENLGQRPL